MTNLTLSIDEGLLKRARIRAIERDTSVNALVREYLEALVASDEPRSGALGFLAFAEGAHASSGQAGRSWARDELHER